jgi:PAS domain S-box-containing protein
MAMVAGGESGLLSILRSVRGQHAWRLLIAAAITCVICAAGAASMTLALDPADAPPTTVLPRAAGIALVLAASLTVLIAISIGAVQSWNRNAATRRLRQAIDVMPEGVAIFDHAGRLRAWNKRYAQMFDGMVELSSTSTFEEIFAEAAAKRAFRGAERDPAAWLGLRLIMFEGEQESDLLVATARGRWVRISERRAPAGDVVSTCVDVTELKTTEGELTVARDRAERLTAIADQAEAVARIGHYRIDIKTRAYEASAGFAQLHGLPKDTPVNAAMIAKVTDPDDARHAGRLMQQLISGEATEVSSIRRIRLPNGELRYLLGTLALERFPGMKPTALIGTVVDITELKRAEGAVAESEARFRSLAQNAPDIIVESDPEGRVTYISPACETITGYQSEELLGHGFASIIHPDDVEQLAERTKQLRESEGAAASQMLVFRIRCKSGDVIWLESKPTYLADRETGEHSGFIDVIRDVTSRVRLEAEIEAARAEAEAAAAVKAEFLANMSHELRTPLTSIIGFIGMAAQQKDLSPATRQYVERVTDASKALLCTVNDILDFSKLEAGQVAIRPEPVRLLDLARGALELFSPQAGAKDLELELDMDEDVCVLLDPNRIRQILLNLAGNAVKFTERGCVTVRTRYDASREWLTIEVADTGAGIPPEKLEQLFKRFSQVDGSRTRAQGGTGLGLAICKGLAEAMGGEIGVASQEGEGSRFWIRIPAPRTMLAEVPADQSQAEETSLSGLKVLVVDDHPANRELARLYLTGSGAEVMEAEDGEAAVIVASGPTFDVILMDLRMPRLDGIGAMKQIRAQPGPNQSTPIVAFTADLTSEGAADLCSKGFDGGVAKPIEGTRLLDAVASAALRAPGRQASAA